MNYKNIILLLISVSFLYCKNTIETINFNQSNNAPILSALNSTNPSITTSIISPNVLSGLNSSSIVHL